MKKKPSATIVCGECGQQVKIKPYLLKKKTKTGERFCSMSCKSRYAARNNPVCQSRKIEAVCPACAKHFFIQPNMKKGVKNNYCSRECLGKFTSKQKWEGQQPKTVSIQCNYCSNDISLKKWDFDQKTARGQSVFYCDRSCFGAWKAANWSGKDNPAWKGGWTKHGKGWEFIRGIVREEQGYTCKDCGVTEIQLGKQLDIHHIKPARLFESKKEASYRENLVGLCHPCHMKWERRVTE